MRVSVSAHRHRHRHRVCTPAACARWPRVRRPLFRWRRPVSGRAAPRVENAPGWCSLPSCRPGDRPPPPALPLSGPQPAPGGYFHLAGKAGSCGPCWPGGTPAGTYTRVFLVQSWDAAKEVVSAFGEPTALPLRVRGVGKGEARVGKTDLYPCRTRSTPFFKMLTFMPVRSKTFSLTEYFKP